jgi:hypothetical protein
MTRTPGINPSSSLVHESIVVREVRLCMLGRIERIRRIEVIGKTPVADSSAITLDPAIAARAIDVREAALEG